MLQPGPLKWGYQLLCNDRGQAGQNPTLDGRIAIFILEMTDEQPRTAFPFALYIHTCTLSFFCTWLTHS